MGLEGDGSSPPIINDQGAAGLNARTGQSNPPSRRAGQMPQLQQLVAEIWPIDCAVQLCRFRPCKDGGRSSDRHRENDFAYLNVKVECFI